MSCFLCGAPGKGRTVLAHPEGALVQCPGCGVVTAKEMPAPREARKLYDARYFDDPDRGYRDYEGDEAIFRREFRRRLRRISKRGLSAGARLLDVGCATGGLLKEAKTMGLSAEGLEPSEEVAAKARAESGCAVRAGVVEEAEYAEGTFDAITAFEVIEHLPNPVSAIARLRPALKPAGWFAVSVPDYGSLWAKWTGKRWPMITPREHLVYFTKRTLRLTLERSGFQEVHFLGASTVFSLGTVLTKLGLRRVPGLLAHVPVRLPFGTLLAVAR